MSSPIMMNQVGCGSEKKLAIAESVKMLPAMSGNFLLLLLEMNLIKKPHKAEPIIQPVKTNSQNVSD